MTRLHITIHNASRVLVRHEPLWPLSWLIESTYQELYHTGREWADTHTNRPASTRVADAIDKAITVRAVKARMAATRTK